MIEAERQEVRGMLREGMSLSAIARYLGRRDLEPIRRVRNEMLVCERCAEPLREPDHLCGFCRGETGAVA